MPRQLIFGSLCLWAAAASMSHAAQTPPAVALPRPTGPFTVGTTAFSLVDEARTDPLADKPEPRQVRVVAWYPAVNGATGDAAPYLREGLAEARSFATLLRQPDTGLDYLATTRTHGILDAPPRTGDPLPVLIFSHGYTAIASSYTALLEDLASHGYAVLSVVHPYEAMAATLSDGRVVTMLDGQKQMRKSIRDVLGEWGKEDETMAAVTTAQNEADALRLMRGYLEAIPITTRALKRWVDDTVLVTDRLAALPAGPAGRLASRLELKGIGAFGHSMGGVTSAAFCAVDRHCQAALNLDGIPQYGTLIDSPMNRPFMMVYSGRTGRLGASDVIYRRAAKPYQRVDVADTLHVDFSDMGLWGGPLAGRPMFGKLPADRAVAVTRQIVREYFDEQLRGLRSGLLSGRSPIAGVRVHPPVGGL
jgi:predicted dienelactone hydrolase